MEQSGKHRNASLTIVNSSIDVYIGGEKTSLRRRFLVTTAVETINNCKCNPSAHPQKMTGKDVLKTSFFGSDRYRAHDQKTTGKRRLKDVTCPLGLCGRPHTSFDVSLVNGIKFLRLITINDQRM